MLTVVYQTYSKQVNRPCIWFQPIAENCKSLKEMILHRFDRRVLQRKWEDWTDCCRRRGWHMGRCTRFYLLPAKGLASFSPLYWRKSPRIAADFSSGPTVNVYFIRWHFALPGSIWS